MTQPKFAPIPIADEVRPARRLGPAAPWVAGRPGELVSRRPVGGEQPRAGRGTPGPDQGYALRLAERFAGRLVLGPGERAEDVLAGAVAVALRRAALFGRAPVARDLEVVLTLFAFLGEAGATPELLAARKAAFAGIGHDGWRQRALANGIDEELLRCTLDEAAARRLGVVQLAAL